MASEPMILLAIQGKGELHQWIKNGCGYALPQLLSWGMAYPAKAWSTVKNIPVEPLALTKQGSPYLAMQQ